MTVIHVRSVTKKFGDFLALDTISFKVQKGEVVGFVGANGAGKTTTISTILGFIAPTEGEVALFGDIIHPSGAHKQHKRIGYAAGDMELPPRLTGRQYLSFLLHQADGDHTARLEELQRRFQPQLDKTIRTLSRGNKQKIALIGAFVTEPELIVLDEPTSGLDPVMQDVFLELIREVAAAGTTVFMSSHYLNEVADVCSRVILMREGRVVEDVSSRELLKRSGKVVRIVTGHQGVKPPKASSEASSTKDGHDIELSFIYKGDAAELQRWVAGLKLLRDIEITEYNLEGAFKSMYMDEEKTV